MGPVAQPETAMFRERPTAPIVGDALWLGAVPLGLAVVCAALGWVGLAVGLLCTAGFVGFFFRNPSRAIPGDEATVVAPADGRVVAAGEIEEPDGRKFQRVGIFLSIFDVHVNRAPVAGRVVAVERGGSAYRAAFDSRAESDNVRCTLTLETAGGARVRVAQIVGLVARRVVCHPHVGEWMARGTRYGLIRFGSRTDVILPPAAELRVARGDRVRGGSSVIAILPGREP